MTDTGDHYGAVRFSSLDDLYPRQRTVAKAILKAVHAVAAKAFSTPRADPDRAPATEPDSFVRPHNAYVIDGARGSGKTTLLLTLQRFMSVMTLDGSRSPADQSWDAGLVDQIRRLELRKPSNSIGSERVAMVLPIVFLEDMEPSEATMEAIFAHLERQIERELVDSAPNRRRETLEKLQRELRREISVAWTYSRKIGVEALSNDALDYGDFVERRAQHNRQAYMRIERWHAFIEKFLNAMGVQTLVLLFDDSDLNLAAAEDILGAIRMYLSHPRVVSIVALELLTLQSTMLGRKLPAQRDAIEILWRLDPLGAERILEDVRRNTMALIDKVLPVNLRHRLANEDMDHLDHFFNGEQVAGGRDCFSSWCVTRFEVEGQPPRTKFAWFLLAKPYRRLVADNVRRIIAFRDETEATDADPVAALLRFFGLHDLPIGEDVNSGQLDLAIVDQNIAAGWHKSVSPIYVDFEEQSVDVEGDDDEGGPQILDGVALTFVEFWLDLKIAQAKLDVTHLDEVQMWLPADQLSAGSLAIAEDEGKTLGVAALSPTVPLPRNCLYLYQFRRLSGVALKPLPDISGWSSLLSVSTANLPNFSRAAKALIGETRAGPDRAILYLGVLSSNVRSASFRTHADKRELGHQLVLALYAALASSEGYGGFVEILDAVAEDSAHGDALADFVARLEGAYLAAERARQEALFVWACALEVAQTGDDNLRLKASLPRRHLEVEFAAAFSRPRLPDLVRPTVECLKLANRHALLLAWSIGPLLTPLHELGSVHAEADTNSNEWFVLAQAYSQLVTQNASRETTASASPCAGDWDYADFSEADLSRIRADVEAAEARFKTTHKPSEAGARRTFRDWPTDPALLVAGILGTSVAWTKQTLVQNG